jgi:REP element-mobilizing transposase RayT
MTFDSIHDDSHLYFVTAALCGWKHLFNQAAYANIVLGSLSWLRREKRMYLYAFVLMPSRIHAIVKPIDLEIGALLQNFGSFTAHAILRQLRDEKRDELLQFFHEQTNDHRHQHRIWQDLQAKNIYSLDFLRQKLEYIHNNPVN